MEDIMKFSEFLKVRNEETLDEEKLRLIEGEMKTYLKTLLKAAGCSLLTGGVLSKNKCFVGVYTKYINGLQKDLAKADTPERKAAIKDAIEKSKKIRAEYQEKAKKDWRPDPNKKIF